MAETNINAYKNELVLAERDLGRAQARVDGLRSYIESIEPKPKNPKKEEVPKEVSEKETEEAQPSEKKSPKKGGK